MVKELRSHMVQIKNKGKMKKCVENICFQPIKSINQRWSTSSRHGIKQIEDLKESQDMHPAFKEPWSPVKKAGRPGKITRNTKVLPLPINTD